MTLRWNSTGEFIERLPTSQTTGTVTTSVFYLIPTRLSWWRRLLRRLGR